MKKIFVDGQSGTTGLLINERLSRYDNLEILHIDPEKRKDNEEKKKYLNAADIVFLCLPDEAAKESVCLIDNPHTKVIDASTAHRTNKDWTYGIAELSSGHREAIAETTRLANPGCHATAFVTSIYPLVASGLLDKGTALSCHSLTGYSGGGKALIEKFQDTAADNPYRRGPMHYALSLGHKHLPEMTIQAGLSVEPNFMPIVGDFYKGLVATTQMRFDQLSKSMTGFDLHEFFSDYYKDAMFVNVQPYDDASVLFNSFFDVCGSNDTNNNDLFIFANDEKGTFSIMSRLDNLGKGASGAAIQNMNIMLGLEEWTNLL